MNRRDEDLEAPDNLAPPHVDQNASAFEWLVVLVLVTGLCITFLGAALGLGSLSIYLGPALIGVVVLPYAVLKLINTLAIGFGFMRTPDVLDLDEKNPHAFRRWSGKPRRMAAFDMLFPVAILAMPVLLLIVIMML